jgi:hypothetical protein
MIPVRLDHRADAIDPGAIDPNDHGNRELRH